MCVGLRRPRSALFWRNLLAPARHDCRATIVRTLLKGATSAAVFAVLGLGCSAEAPIILPDLPDEVSWVAIVYEDNFERRLESTGLFRPDDAVLSVVQQSTLDEVGRIRALGFSEDAGREAGSLLESDLFDVPVLPQGANDPLIPGLVGEWLASYEDRVFTEEPNPSAWTSRFLPSCPEMVIPGGAETAIDNTCIVTRCAPMVRQEGCSVYLNLSSCGLDYDVVRVAGDGGPVVDAPCRAGTPPDGATWRIDCPAPSMDCYADLYVGPFSDPFDVETVAVLPGAQPDAPINVHGGYLGGLAIVGERLLVTSFGGAFHGQFREWNPETEFHFVNRSTLAVEESVSGPAGVSLVAAHPDGQSFYAVFDRTKLGRFDAAGRLMAEDVFDVGDLTQSSIVSAIAVGGNPLRVAVALVPDASGNVQEVGRVLFFDPDTLVLTQLSAMLRDFLPGLVWVGSDRVAVASNPTSSVQIIGAIDGATIEAYSLHTGREVNRGPDHLLYLPSSEQFVASSPGLQRPAAQVIDLDDGGTTDVISYLRFGGPVAVVPSTVDPGRVVCAMIGETPEESWLTIMDPGENRYVPVASQKVADGPLALGLADEDGSIWFLSRATAEVIRVTERPEPL